MVNAINPDSSRATSRCAAGGTLSLQSSHRGQMSISISCLSTRSQVEHNNKDLNFVRC
jgi:hypothetical protein